MDILSIFSTIVPLLAATVANVNRQNDLERTAYKALSEAIAQTERLLENCDVPREPSPELTNAWNQASLDFAAAKISKLSRLCRIKGDYWYNPGSWSEAEVQEAGIKLYEMRNSLDKVLREDF